MGVLHAGFERLPRPSEDLDLPGQPGRVLFNFNLVRGVVKIFENVDNFTAKMGIHTFCLLYWRSKK